MADRVSAWIVLGGSLSATDYAELVDVIAGERLSTDWDGPPFEAQQRKGGEPLSLFAHEVTGGQFDELEAWCVEHKLPFARSCDGYPGAWAPERVVFTGEGEPQSYAADGEDVVVISAATAKTLGSFDAIMAYFEAADFKIPALEIQGELAEAAS